MTDLTCVNCFSIIDSPETPACPVCGKAHGHGHTPGPWGTSTLLGANPAEGRDPEWTVTALDDEGGALDMLCDLTGCPNPEANANLIAAAPDLLAVARAALALVTDPDAEAEQAEALRDLARAAIAKAEGR